MTPNLCGADGISRLSRLVAGSFDAVNVLALHEPVSMMRFRHAAVRGAGGSSRRFAVSALGSAAHADRCTRVIVTHLHLAPAALAFAARGSSLTIVLCGVEAWQPITLLQRAALDRATRLMAISSFTREGFRRANPHFAERDIDVCHLGVEPFDDLGPVPAGNPSALIVGRMAGDERYKGHDALLEIWRDVAAAVPGASLRVVGDGDDRPRLERKAAQLDLGDRVTFLGRLDDRSLLREYGECTAFVMPSRDEGFGFVFVEAMRAARACIGSRGAASEIIAEGDTGLLVDAGDRAQLLEAVTRVLRDRPLTGGDGCARPYPIPAAVHGRAVSRPLQGACFRRSLEHSRPQRVPRRRVGGARSRRPTRRGGGGRTLSANQTRRRRPASRDACVSGHGRHQGGGCRRVCGVARSARAPAAQGVVPAPVSAEGDRRLARPQHDEPARAAVGRSRRLLASTRRACASVCATSNITRRILPAPRSCPPSTRRRSARSTVSAIL